MKKLPIVLFLLIATACASQRSNSEDVFEARDSARSVNEQIFAFNLGVDKVVVRPVAEIYKQAPKEAKTSVNNLLSNLGEPENMVNGVLQMDAELTFTAFWRFVLNSTFGFAGLRDFAGENGLKERDTDLGKTLAKYGVEEGDYVVLPLAGPSTVRDTTGKIVDIALNPISLVLTVPEMAAKYSAQAVATREKNSEIIDQFYYESLEPYTATRAAYLQHQAFQK